MKSAAIAQTPPPARNAAAARRLVVRAVMASHQPAGGELDARHVAEKRAMILDRRSRRQRRRERLLQFGKSGANAAQRDGILFLEIRSDPVDHPLRLPDEAARVLV